MRHTIISAVLITMGIWGTAPARSFYVSSSVVADGDGSLSSPWKSLSKVTDATFAPGDTVRFMCGSSWSGVCITIAESGTPAQPIVLTSYGSGNKPVFSNNVYGPNLTYITNMGRCIYLTGSHIIIDGLKFEHCAREVRNDPATIPRVGAVKGAVSADYIVVKNCEFFDCPIGVHLFGEHTLITGNYFHDCNRALDPPAWGPLAVVLNKGNAEISYNRFENYYFEGDSCAWGADGGAIEFDDMTSKSNIYIHHNFSRNNCGFMETFPNLKDNIVVAHNVSIDYDKFWGCNGAVGAKVLNNTILRIKRGKSNYEDFNWFWNNANARSTIWRNNIFVIGDGVPPVFSNGPGSQQERSNNLYFCADATCSNTAARLICSGCSLGPGEKIGDPKFVSCDYKNWPCDLRLQSSSPAINLGIDVGLNHDFDGNPITGGKPDAGAYEYQISLQAAIALQKGASGSSIRITPVDGRGFVITLTLGQATKAHRLDILDMSGNIVRTYSFTGGYTSVFWDRANGKGRPVSAGLYCVKLSSDGSIAPQRLIVR